MKKSILIPILIIISSTGFSQTVFNAREYIDIGNIKTSMGVHGSMWEDSIVNQFCEFPKGSGKAVGYTSSIWLGGKINGSYVAAAGLYSSYGVDYWPGPIVNINDPSVSYSESQKWAKVWKVNQIDIINFLSQTTHTLANTPLPILEWPGKGNVNAKGNNGVSLFVPMADYQRNFAPFIDVNNDGVYNPLSGDYPQIKGDQALWAAFNDNGAGQHLVTKSIPLGVEVHCLAYAYKRNSLIDNVIFYEYEVINRKGLQIDSFRIGFFADMDMGFPTDDYMGYDSSRNLGVVYNAKTIDGNGEPASYGNTIPQAGISILEMPGMSCGVFKPAGSFAIFSNASTSPPFQLRDPTNADEFNYYLRSRLKNGQQFINSQYAANGDPSDPTKITECSGLNAPGDRRMVVATGDTTFLPGATWKFSVALVASNPSLNNGCPNANFTDIGIVADTAMKIYCNPLPPITTYIPQCICDAAIYMYPNPANDLLHIKGPNTINYDINVYDALGRKMKVASIRKGYDIAIDIKHLPQGLYSLHLKGEDINYVNKFVKE